jgi:hypothetical protein
MEVFLFGEHILLDNKYSLTYKLKMQRKHCHAVGYHCLLLTLWYTLFCTCPNISGVWGSVAVKALHY